MSLVVDTRQAGDVTILEVSGRITLGDGARTLRNAILAMVRDGRQKILISLANVTFIDSSGLGVLVSAFATQTNRGGDLKLLNVTSRVKDLLLITKLYTVFDVFDEENTALRSFAPRPAEEPVSTANAVGEKY
jgi:anti-sigma B factor antagonist